MNSSELLIVLLVGGCVLGIPLITFILAIVAFTRSKQIVTLATRVATLEYQLRQLANLPVSDSTPRPTAFNESGSESVDGANSGAVLVATLSPQATSDGPVLSPQSTAAIAGRQELPASWSEGAKSEDPVGWETFVGQKAFGWTAVLLFVLSAAFFLRYAFQNNWIGPVGRVAIGELVGIALAFAGVIYFRKGMMRFSSMLTAAGLVVLYLSTYSAFGFYQLLPPGHAGIFLAILIVESMLVAVIYRSAGVAIAAVIGGLLTPILLASSHDTYWSFFSYLAILNLGVVASSLYRRWALVATISLLGSQWLFWMWYASQYHPEKFTWAIGFQLFLFVIYLLHSVRRSRDAEALIGREELIRFLANALFAIMGFHVLLREDHREWLGTVALLMAAVYAFSARLVLNAKSRDQRLLLLSLAISLGLIAWALPLQASVHGDTMVRWVTVGWAVIGLALWRFGLRVSSPSLRVMAAVFALAAACRLLVSNLPFYVREPFVPLFNHITLPSVLTAICIVYGVVSAGKQLRRLSNEEQTMVGWTGVIGVSLLWLALSFDCYGYFVSQSLYGGEIEIWRWRGQLALTVFWTLFATSLLVIGFWMDRARIRWLAIALYVITVGKLFLFDMANVQQIYRILAFFVLAVVLGLVARAYQRFK